ncbi:helix-turn-helix domain-containing protein [uncultured Draconibacterium sp.]|uniref:helix-turn-helix domain-containing protein n=1 Tax=uncultured Draconibacterium sp. TaxID=1573823 RepID=UPI0029C98398|nr:helix-turn-helix domain-containing protein [uncultured Draconibacterium sp.]
MSDTSIFGADFIEKAEAIILENISNEQFGVSELAGHLNMSRSSLLRKIKTHTQLSASQFIRQVRVTKGMEMLKQTSLTVAEISYEVGFGNTSYFIKCFREQYGYSPGEVRKGVLPEENENVQETVLKKYRWYWAAALVLVAIVLSVILFNRKNDIPVEIEKSIAVLPFVNESSDSLNLYFVNGLMESTLNNLQKISDLRVISRTSVAKYRDTDKGIPEIAEELNVNYLVEGSGQRFGNQVLLNIQLIEAATDRPIWGEQYSREVDDVFALQNEVARKIADAIQAVVTPAELKQIEKIPTENLEAYDYYLRALNLYYNRTEENLKKAISLFEKAIEEDDQFALAYANVAISYYFLDVNQKEKQYTEQINNFADKALLYDSRSAESLIAKALYYIQMEEYNLALPHLEKALEYNPNSSAVVQMLADLYARVIPNTAKYLEYALKGIQLDIAASDSIGKSFIYLHLSNALIQNGFIDEAATYIDKSLDFNPENYYAPLVKTYILYAKDGDAERTKKLMLNEWRKDTSRLDLLQEVAKVYYFEEDYDSAFYYFEKFVDARDKYGLNIYPQEDVKIAWVYKKMGLKEQAAKFFDNYKEYCNNDESIYKSASMAVMYAYEGKYEEAVEQLKIFATQDNYQYWILVFEQKDPIMKPFKNNPDYHRTNQKIEDRFWKKHETIEKVLAEKGLI